MLEQIKQISRQTGEAETPTRFLFGTVTKLSPLTVFVDSRFYLSGPGLAELRRAEGGEPLAEGDKVVLLRNQGGQQYLILGRV